MEIKTSQRRRGKAVYSEITIARKSTTVTCILAQRQEEEWESFIVEKKRSFGVCPDWKLLAWENCRWAKAKVGHPV